MAVNQQRVASGFHVLRQALAPYICAEIEKEYGERWWADGVLGVLNEEQKRHLPQTGVGDELADSIDIGLCLKLLTAQWVRIFDSRLSADDRTWARELVGVRNRNAHAGGKDHADDYTWRALDTMFRLCSSVDPALADELLSARSSIDLSASGHVAPSDVAQRMAQVHAVAQEPPGLGVGEASAEADDEAQGATGLDFGGADLQGANFRGAILDGADFGRANLTGAVLAAAKLRGANFRGAILTNADLYKADLTGAYFDKAALASLKGAKLASVNLTDVNWA